MHGSYLDDTTTDIEKYLKSKESDEVKKGSPEANEAPRRKLNFGMISNFLKQQEEFSDQNCDQADINLINGIKKHYDQLSTSDQEYDAGNLSQLMLSMDSQSCNSSNYEPRNSYNSQSTPFILTPANHQTAYETDGG